MDAGELMNALNAYFNDLNEYEKYSWIVAAAGLLLTITGIILLFW